MGRQARLSDFVSQEDIEELRRSNTRGKRGKRQFDDVDALAAEIIARFGYELYKDWNAGLFDHTKLMRMLSGERARERAAWIPVETIIEAMVGSCIKRHKGDKAPKGPKIVRKIIKSDIKTAQGER